MLFTILYIVHNSVCYIVTYCILYDVFCILWITNDVYAMDHLLHVDVKVVLKAF